MPERILVIKLGALGDLVQALSPMAAIRKHHADAHITLLTTKPYAAFAEASGLVDDVWIDADRPKLWQITKVWRLRKRLIDGHFDRVYDLQTSDRSAFYFSLFAPHRKPEWSGVASGCSHPHANPDRGLMHTLERQREQLRMAGINDVPPPDVSWAAADLSRFHIEGPYALLVPGGAAHRPAKRWPPERYAGLARRLLEVGITPVLLGAEAERGVLQLIALDAPGSVNLCAKTDFIDIATLGRGAALAVGNDTGPMHLIAVTGAPSLVLYSADSNPALCAQRGPRVEILRNDDLTSLSEDEVWDMLKTLASGVLTGG